MYALKAIWEKGWCPIFITALAIVGTIYEWPVAVLGTIIGIILIIGLVMFALGARQRELEQASFKLKQLSGYFHRRFTGNSSLSIFAIIDGLFNVDDSRLWAWVQACDMSQRVFNTWNASFTSRLEVDTRTGRFTIYVRSYLNELWLMSGLYYEFVQQFHEIAQKIALPAETLEQYHKFVVEYNSFVEQFRDSIGELKQIAGTEIEPPSVKEAHEVLTAPPKAEKETARDPRKGIIT